VPGLRGVCADARGPITATLVDSSRARRRGIGIIGDAARSGMAFAGRNGGCKRGRNNHSNRQEFEASHWVPPLKKEPGYPGFLKGDADRRRSIKGNLSSRQFNVA
jgi:hypothetical protein